MESLLPHMEWSLLKWFGHLLRMPPWKWVLSPSNLEVAQKQTQETCGILHEVLEEVSEVPQLFRLGCCQLHTSPLHFKPKIQISPNTFVTFSITRQLRCVQALQKVPPAMYYYNRETISFPSVFHHKVTHLWFGSGFQLLQLLSCCFDGRCSSEQLSFCNHCRILGVHPFRT